MNDKKFAVFVHGFDGIDKALTVIKNINKVDVNLHLYTYNSSMFPSFFLQEFSEVFEIKQTFYSRSYKNKKEKFKDRISFFNLFYKLLFSNTTKIRYEELHILGHMNNPSFLIYEIFLRKKTNKTFIYKIPDKEFYKPIIYYQDLKLKLLKFIFSRSFNYINFPPDKTAIGLSESYLKTVDEQSWSDLGKNYKLNDTKLEIDVSDKNKILVLGTAFAEALGTINLETTAINVTNSIEKNFPHKNIYYKPHYRSDFDLLMPNMKVLESNIPAELIIPYFDVVIGFDTTVFYSCELETRIISCLKLIKYDYGDMKKDLEILKNNSGSKNFFRLEFLC